MICNDSLRSAAVLTNPVDTENARMHGETVSQRTRTESGKIRAKMLSARTPRLRDLRVNREQTRGFCRRRTADSTFGCDAKDLNK